MSNLSGIEINDNGPVTGTVTGTQSRTFTLPTTFKRGNRIPEITGLQFCHDISDAENFAVDFSVSINLITGPITLASGTLSGANTTGTYIWSEIYFDEPIKVSEDWLINTFTATITTLTPTWTTANGLRFRLLANVADTDEDFLGNKFRSIAIRNAPDTFDTRLGLTDSYWLSKPNPSKFGVESLYFDMRDFEGRPSIVDRLLLDPITPGVVFHMYYSNDGVPGTNDDEWDDRLWNPVSTTFHADRRQEHALPEPVVGKYIKLEFSHLQAKYYAPGTFHQPVVYKKYPKWVIDYFLAELGFDLTNDPYVARRVGVTFDAFDLAYNYYLDDLRQDPSQPEQLKREELASFMADRKDQSDQVDYDTLSRIKLSLQPFQQPTGQLGNGVSYAPALYSEISNLTNNYPIERLTRAVADTTQVSNSNRTSLVVEHNFPAMFFYLTARHKYRRVSASFSEDRGYFVGIRELAFTRDIYSERYDGDLYIETLTDPTNTIRNDFLEDGYPKPRPVKH